jgi:orotidine-5'-phosphate decarboxylase
VSGPLGQRLADAVARRESQVVLGIDPDPVRLWPAALAAAPADLPPAERAAAAVVEHCRLLIEAAGPACVAAKPQLACFERLGPPGWRALFEVSQHVRAAGLVLIADAKRGDIDVSARSYAQALFGPVATPFGELPGLRADLITVSPLLGRDSLEAFLGAARAADGGLLVLVRTSNPGAEDVQALQLADGGTVSERLAAIVHELGALGPAGPLADVGAVVGATQPAHLARLRELMPRAIFLLPGIGAQGGRVEDLAPAFAAGRAGALVSASRSIADAHTTAGGDPASAARRAADRIRQQAWALV